ncbi:histidine kinase [Amycolatopsis sp. NBRC 101858]|uniref:ATP-binding protein n=1 Tax=Amycolatopsis sp. NBRC 101858 TaxID=3032200 RepID=UPI0024A42958|nr:ATP-binding protein [Amycolatopsis sp. NBRC 101858]GLY40166.1 histidine kinase [Amycolatopsis sp. NBRC 101858]
MTRESFEFEADPAQIRLVRSWVREQLAASDVPAEVAADVVLITGELATNAVRHAGGPLRVLLICSDAAVWIGVEDAGGSAWFDPVVPDAAPAGTGLTLVAACSDRRGHFHRRDGGKTVWAEIPLAS